jgi:hypothetical protein
VVYAKSVVWATVLHVLPISIAFFLVVVKHWAISLRLLLSVITNVLTIFSLG